jgi:UrcA family protein
MDYGRAIAICGATFVAAVALGTAAVAVQAHSLPPVVSAELEGGDMLTRRVTYADLDLAFPTGERTLNRRVRGAISSLCSEAARFDGSIEANDLMAQCDHAAWVQARPQIKRAVDRARDVASTGTSPVVAATIAVAFPK